MNIPEFYLLMLKDQYSEKILNKIIEGLNSKRNLTLRINRLKTDRNYIINYFKERNFKFTEITWFKDDFILKDINESDIRKMSIYEDGQIYLQSLSSMIPPLILNPKEQENILDMCAAPGGKTTEMASISNDKAFITAIEKNKIRAERLKYNINKQGANKVNVLLEDSISLSDFLKFDKILLDAPCSGSGTENIFKDNFTIELIKKSCIIQEKLLNKAIQILKPGGEIIYSTCSILQNENEQIIKKVLEKNNNCKLVQVDLPNEIECIESIYSETKTIMPSDEFEGFFIAKIKKN